MPTALTLHTIICHIGLMQHIVMRRIVGDACRSLLIIRISSSISTRCLRSVNRRLSRARSSVIKVGFVVFLISWPSLDWWIEYKSVNVVRK